MKLKKLKLSFIGLCIAYWLPFAVIWFQYPAHKTLDSLPSSESVIVFGTLVRNGVVSPLLKERLDASIAIYLNHKAKNIVVSNRKKASHVMQQYLLNNNIPGKDIVLDITAEKTPDTCHYEKQQHPKQRKLIFISQGYHLYRIQYQCKKIGVIAAAYPAEKIRKKRPSTLSSFNVFSVRFKRYFREAGLTWLALLNIYK